MKDLNVAWELVRVQLAAEAMNRRQAPPPRTSPHVSEQFGSGDEALDWLVDALLSAADDYGDSVDGGELKYMLQPFRKVRSTRKLERWIARRTPTMLAAIADSDIDDWQRCAACLDAKGVDAVVIMLLDQCLPG